jgi:hypothetical protein
MDPCNFGAPATTVSNRQILDDFVPQFTHLLTVSTATLDPKYIDTTNEYYQFLHPRIPPNSHKKRDNRGEGTNQEEKIIETFPLSVFRVRAVQFF